MKTTVIFLFVIVSASISGCRNHQVTGTRVRDTLLIGDTIQYHAVRINQKDGSILPWYSADPGTSYDTVLMLVWDFWKNMETDSNGLKYYMNHQVWKPEHDMRGLGGDQINMALSSWALLYAYTGDATVVENMKYMADTYLERSLSKSCDKWPYIPYPYNTDIHSGIYDGDMRNGKDITQPDKAGTFGYELINLFKITGDKRYLEAAAWIAGTLRDHLQKGDENRSPLPFRVNIWLTDGYGDYVRHYLRAMAVMPELAPDHKNRFLGTTSTVTSIGYKPDVITYSTYNPSTDVLRLTGKPKEITCDGTLLTENSGESPGGYTWKPLSSGGVLQITHTGRNLEIRL